MDHHHQHAADVLLGSLESSDLGTGELEFIKRFNPAGITLFSRNIESSTSQKLSNLIKEFQAHRRESSPPRIIAIDQEGGRVRRLKDPFPNLGPAQELSAGSSERESLASIEAYGRLVGRSLDVLGINVNFAPVVDVLSNPKNQCIGDRAFGSTPEQVSARAGAFLRGQNSSPVKACLKHFPGQGGSTEDTHLEPGYIKRTIEEISGIDLIPFQELSKDASMIMLSHCIYPALDASTEASLSRKIIGTFLKKKLNYRGLVVTDDMTMGAIAKKKEVWEDLLIRSIEAGADLALICRGLTQWESGVTALAEQAKASPTFAKRLSQASQKVLSLRLSLKN